MDEEFLDDRICQQLGCQLGHPLLARRLAELDLEPLALPDARNLAKTKSPAGTGDGLTLRVVDFRLQHHVDDESRHMGTVREHRSPLRLGRASGCAVAWATGRDDRF